MLNSHWGGYNTLFNGAYTSGAQNIESGSRGMTTRRLDRLLLAALLKEISLASRLGGTCTPRGVVFLLGGRRLRCEGVGRGSVCDEECRCEKIGGSNVKV